jgi:putative NADPH-quinone reductase
LIQVSARHAPVWDKPPVAAAEGATMSRHIVIIQGHPDRSTPHFCHALADAYAAGAEAAGHRVTRIEIAALDTPLLRDQKDFEQGGPPSAVQPAVAALTAADHITFVFPLWLGTLPAVAHGFLEQVMRPGTAFSYETKGFPTPLLKGRSARLVVTIGMPALIYRWWFGAHGVRGLERSVFGLAGIGPIRRTLIGSVGTISPERRSGWLEQMTTLGGQGR